MKNRYLLWSFCFRVNVPESTHQLLCFVYNVISSTAASY